ncbi:MAG: hypothetical protein GPJ23_10240, partial [Microcystis aeruginosa G13-05]|nr:hypothetical protein [Microcystis aeruginosa G13-05]
GSADNTIKLWNVETGQEIRTLKGHDNYVYSVNFSPDGNTNVLFTSITLLLLLRLD